MCRHRQSKGAAVSSIGPTATHLRFSRPRPPPCFCFGRDGVKIRSLVCVTNAENCLLLTRRKFCSEACAVAFHLATTARSNCRRCRPLALLVLHPREAHRNTVMENKSRRHLALRRAWIAEHVSPAGSWLHGKRNTWPKASGPAFDQLREWFAVTVGPLVAKYPLADIRGATGLSTRYVIKIRQGVRAAPDTLCGARRAGGRGGAKSSRSDTMREPEPSRAFRE